MSYSIEAEKLTKRFADFTAVDNISFNVRSGETFAILGENGAGKSTTMRMISCRSPLSGGTLFVNSLDVKSQAKKIKSLLGIVPQENNLDPDLDTFENLLVYARYFRMSKEEAVRKSDELLDFVGLTKKNKSKVEALSGGMKRRLIIARALIHSPQILLLDEPTTGLDPSVRQEIWDKLDELRTNLKITIVLSTHYMDEAEKLCQRLILMDEGKIKFRGSPKKIIKQKVKNFALEVSDIHDQNFQVLNSNILTHKRGKKTVYFAEHMDELTDIMKNFNEKEVFLRPSNLEDVFLFKN